MLNLVKPRYVMPFHGDFKRPAHPCAARRSRRRSPAGHLQGENGLPLDIDERGARFSERCSRAWCSSTASRSATWRTSRCATRRMLSADGIFIVVVTITEQDGTSVAPPEVIFRGVPFLDQADELLEEIRSTVDDSLSRAAREEIREVDLLAQVLHDDLAKLVYDRLKRRPMGPSRRRRGLSRRAGAPTKRAPVRSPPSPLRDWSSTTVPPWDTATACTIASPSPKDPPRSPAPRTKRSNSVGTSSGGTPGPLSSTTSSTWPSAVVAVETLISVPGGVWRSAFSIRFDHQAVQLVVRTLDQGGVNVERDLVLGAHRAQLAGGLDHDLAKVERRARDHDGRRRCGASSSRSATSPCACAARSEGPSARPRRGRPAAGRPQSARRAARGSRARSSSGVRSSCEASATNCRWRASIVSVSLRAASSSRSIPSSVRASSATSSSAADCGSRPGGIAGARDLRRGTRQLCDRPHRPARDRHPGQHREGGPG